ncbi:MAG TPA: tRNA (N6-threonylcarbamoyladenosine(37)-N6)-methyltransferase TrmO [Opitutaceae bacterium]|nr:tRNA (N6-threonylcarbamoyladenosine(37)-N6)-methyltransferase TrmO [Opitutaceae bacterium]
MSTPEEPPSFVTLRPVGVLRTPFAEKFGVPRQSGIIPSAVGTIEFLPEFSGADFVRGIEAFSHLWLVTGFHKNPPWDGAATVRPPRLGGNERVGVFASRSPLRPNGLGLSVVTLLAVEPGRLKVGGVDCVDGTPIFDLKPYLPWCEAIPDARSDWSQAAPIKRPEDQISFPPTLARTVPDDVVALMKQVLALDLRPAYQASESERVYGMALAGWNVRWKQTARGVEVIEIHRLEVKGARE